MGSLGSAQAQMRFSYPFNDSFCQSSHAARRCFRSRFSKCRTTSNITRASRMESDRPVESPSLTVSELLDSLETDENLHMLKHELDQRLYILRVKSTVPDRLKERFAGLNQESSGDIKIPNVATISVSDERDEVLVRDGMRLIVLRTILINGYDLVYQTAPASSGMYDDSYSIHKLENLLQSLDPEQLATREELLHWLLSLGDNHDNPDNRYIVEYIIERLDGYRDGSDKAKADRDYEEWMQS